MKDKICLVTGASGGIGRSTALGLAKLGATVVMVVRNKEKGQAVQAQIQAESGNSAVDLMIADLSSQESIRKLAKDFQAKYKRLDVLVNNAGAVYGQRQLTVDNTEMTLALNYLAPFLLTNLLLPLLETSAPSRVVNVTTKLFNNAKIDFSNLQGERKYTSFRAYTQAKLCDMSFTYELARRLAGTGVTVNSVHPGLTKSNFGRDTMPGLFKFANTPFQMFLQTSDQAAQRVVYLAAAPGVEGVSGKYYADKKPIKSPAQSYDQSIAKQLWDVSAKLVHLS